jgi:hypothetical protein
MANALNYWVKKSLKGLGAVAGNGIQVNACPVYFRDSRGVEHNFQGINYLEAVVQSPLVEEGSGQGLGHPECTRAFATKTVVRESFLTNNGGSDAVKDTLVLPTPGQWLHYGCPTIQVRYTNAQGELKLRTIRKWDNLTPAYLEGEPEFNVNVDSGLLTVKLNFVMVSQGDAEKFRGFGKWRSNGGFLMDINILSERTGATVFNPNLPLKDAQGNLLQVEHVVGPEEYKVLTYLTGMLGHKIGKVVWDAKTGCWEGPNGETEDQLAEMLEAMATRVTVDRPNLNPRVYQMLKAKYGDSADFSFNDENCGVIHYNAPCWVGVQTQIVEVPTTLAFMGKTAIFMEHLAYLGTEFPAIFKEMVASATESFNAAIRFIEIAEGEIPGADDDNICGDSWVISDCTVLKDADKWGYIGGPDEDLTATGIVLDELHIPAGTEFDFMFLETLWEKATKLGCKALTIYAEGTNDNCAIVALDIPAFLALTGNVAQNVYSGLVNVFCLLQVQEEDRDSGWEAEYFRQVAMLQGAIKFLVTDSNALIAKASKTKPIALTLRAGSTIHNSVAEDEIHIHSATADYYGITTGDWLVIGRVPVPGVGRLKVVLNDRVPFGTAVMQAGVKHEIEEGDVDGDSLVAIIIDSRGRIKAAKGKMVNPVAD